MNPRNIFCLFVIMVLFSFNTFADNDDKDYAYPAVLQKNGCNVAYDPYEKLNRKIFVFNSVLDHFILRPVAVAYRNVTNDYTKARVNSFFDNVSAPLTSVNYLLQGDLTNSLKGFWKFVINSTVGIGGLFDVASKTGLTVSDQTFGNTLAHYGVGTGPYLVVPFFGGMNARDVMDPLVLNNTLNPLKYYLHSSFKQGMFAVNMVSSRAEILPFSDYIAKNSPDPYVAIREALHQRREFSVDYPEGFKCPVVKVKE
jgi:phospholipid-binding lipoprotein MlaA